MNTNQSWTGDPPCFPYEPSPTAPVNWQLITRPVKRITRTIEKYDKHGNYKGKEVITEEEDMYDRMVYEQVPYYPYPPYDIICYNGETGQTFNYDNPTLTTDENGTIVYTTPNTGSTAEFNSVSFCAN